MLQRQKIRRVVHSDPSGPKLRKALAGGLGNEKVKYVIGKPLHFERQRAIFRPHAPGAHEQEAYSEKEGLI